MPPPPRSTLFPYPTLFVSRDGQVQGLTNRRDRKGTRRKLGEIPRNALEGTPGQQPRQGSPPAGGRRNPLVLDLAPPIDRKSTRLNPSHANISYAVFCLKKK